MKAKCRVKGSKVTFDETDTANQTLLVACTTDGLLCRNHNQTDNGTCFDYQIQFTCDGKELDRTKCHVHIPAIFKSVFYL